MFNESDESSSDEEVKPPADDDDDEENLSEARLLALETMNNSQKRFVNFSYWYCLQHY